MARSRPSRSSSTPKLAEQLEKLGYRLHLFNRACNDSTSAASPASSRRGSPTTSTAASRRSSSSSRGRSVSATTCPRVIRPDLVLTEDGFTIAELDTVPGGIGLTAWLNQTYAGFGTDDVSAARPG